MHSSLNSLAFNTHGWFYFVAWHKICCVVQYSFMWHVRWNDVLLCNKPVTGGCRLTCELCFVYDHLVASCKWQHLHNQKAVMFIDHKAHWSRMLSAVFVPFRPSPFYTAEKQHFVRQWMWNMVRHTVHYSKSYVGLQIQCINPVN